jgi:ubiquinone/menaquinone biosynthesis C-methylase UbiE
MSFCVKSAISTPATSAKRIQFVPSQFAGFADLMGFHRHLLDDQIRTSALIRAIDSVVKPGDTVIDLGTGTGILAMAAARSGAARVYAIDYASIVDSARMLARENNFGSQIQFIQMDSSEFVLEEKADVIISECFGLLGVGGTMVAALSDMIRRNLKPSGKVIPASMTIHLAPVESEFHAHYVHCWQSRFGFDFQSLNRLAANNLYIATFEPADFIAPPQQVAHMDLLRDLPDGKLEVHANFRIECAARLHGYCGWFDSQLSDDNILSTGPYSPQQIWQQLYLPLQEEVRVNKDAEIALDLAVIQSYKRSAPVSFYWKTSTADPSGTERCYVQSTLKSSPIPGRIASQTEI